MVLIPNTISLGKIPFGMTKTDLNSEVVLILDGLNSEILLYFEMLIVPHALHCIDGCI